jgi:Aspartyl protease
MKAASIRAVLMTIVVSLCLSTSETDAKPPVFPKSDALHMDVYQGYLIIVDASIGQLHGLRFLLDTGATHTSVDRKLAQRLGLALHPGEIISFDKSVRIYCAELPELSYGPEYFSDVPVVVQDMRYFLTIGLRVDGIIGWDLLRTGSFRLDFAKRQVSFGPTSPFPGSSVPLQPEALFLTVQADLDGRPVSMIADTGLFGTAFYEGTVNDARENCNPVGRAMGRSVGGAVKSRSVVVPRLRLGNQDLDREVQLVQRPTSNPLPGIAGYLGISALDAKQIVFDLEHKQLRWSKK